MPSGRYVVQAIEAVVHGVVAALGLLVLVLFFLPVALTLPAWPLLPWNDVQRLLKIYQRSMLRLVELARPMDAPIEKRLSHSKREIVD